MSRSISVCLRAVVALVALFGTVLSGPAPVLAASGTLSMETPLHESPAHGAPVVALLPGGSVVSIDGPPVDGFYPVTAGDLAGWMRGETLSLEKDVVAEGGEADPPPAQSDGLVPIEQTTTDDSVPVDASAPVDPATDPAPAAEPAVETAKDPAWTEPVAEPVADDAYDDVKAAPADASALPADAAVDPSPVSAPTPVEATPVEAAPVEAAPADAAALESTVETIGAETPVPVAPATEPPVEAAAEPAPDASLTPDPAPLPEPVGPASVTVDAPIRTGPGTSFDLIFTVPMGSTIQQTGNVTDGYVTVQYKEVTGWLALQDLGAPSSFVEETPPAETAAPVETTPVEPSPAATESAPADPVPAEPVAVRTPRPGSGVAFTTVDMSLRAGPSATEEPITVVPAGSRVVLTGVMEGGFQRVTYHEEIGWIADQYLETPADPDSGRNGDENSSRRQIVRIIYAAADRYGQSRSDMLRVAECESNLDPYAVNPSGSYGLFQFIRSTWRSTPFGNKDIFDPEANANAAAWMWSEGRKSEWVCQ